MAIVGSGAGGAVAAATLAEAGLDVLVLESGPYVDRDSYPTDPLEGLPLMYRDGGMTIALGQARHPGARRPHRRRDHRDQLRHLLPRARGGARGVERARGHRLGAGAGPDLRVRRGDAGGEAARPRADGAKRAALHGGRGRDRRQRRSDQPQRRGLRAVQLLPARLPARCQAGRARLLPAAGGQGRGAGASRRPGPAGADRGRPRPRDRMPSGDADHRRPRSCQRTNGRPRASGRPTGRCGPRP